MVMDDADVYRILDNLTSQGEGEAVTKWFWTHVCCDCEYRRNKDGKNEETRKT